MSSSRFVRVFVTAATVSTAALAGTTPEGEPTPQNGHCAFSDHRVEDVVPYRLHAHASKTALHQLGGVEIFVAAEGGLTAARLEQELELHVLAVRERTMAAACSTFQTSVSLCTPHRAGSGSG